MAACKTSNERWGFGDSTVGVNRNAGGYTGVWGFLADSYCFYVDQPAGYLADKAADAYASVWYGTPDPRTLSLPPGAGPAPAGVTWTSDQQSASDVTRYDRWKIEVREQLQRAEDAGTWSGNKESLFDSLETIGIVLAGGLLLLTLAKKSR